MQEKKKILLIDDFFPLLEEVSEFLTFEGFSVVTAKDGAEGVQRAIQHMPDLILCDIEMPNMDGYAVFNTLAQIPTLKNIPFIFATARAQAEDFKKGLKLGVDDYITKPYEIDELLLSIQRRFDKIEHIKSSQAIDFDTMANNPLLGIFIYVGDSFSFVNDKLLSMTGFTQSELNQLELAQSIATNPQGTMAKICLCAKGGSENVRLEFSVYDKHKKLLFVEFFGKHIQMEGKNALLGSILEIHENDNATTASPVQFSELIDYMKSISKEEIAEEIAQANKLLGFSKEAHKYDVKNKVKLSDREIGVLELICKGYKDKEIAAKLFISPRTVGNHRANLLSKTGTKNTAMLVAYSISNGLIGYI